MNQPLLISIGLLSLVAQAQPKREAPPKAPAQKAPAPAKAPVAAGPVEKTDTEFSLAPLPAGTKVGWAHAPYEDGDCSLCHERKDPKNPGKLTGPVNQVCLSCHEEFGGVLARQHVHRPTKKSCSNCHNAHNSVEKRLLHAEVPKLCFSCHDVTEKDIANGKVQHLAIKEGRKCMNCHNPHSSEFERMLVKAPFDLCVGCHDTDELKDPQGKKLANIGKLLKENKEHHKPVAEKDCSACHTPHGGQNFRLLIQPYPAEFYSAFEPAKYGLCWECHKAETVQAKETTTLTSFRDGSRNLHYVHVNVAGDRGRTCRACHEVHAAKQPHIIRDAVPFGPRGWMLKANFKPLPNGGQCEKTCHATKTYVNRGEKPVAEAKPEDKKLPEKKK